ncbi:MAG: hypothetical protein WCA78_15580 [Rhizomicrobium sp.]
MVKRRVKPGKVTKADYERAAAFLLSVGAKAASVELTPGRVRIVTTDGQGMTLNDEQADLDRELAEFRAKHGY